MATDPSERVDSTHQIFRERMARRLASHLYGEITAGRMITTVEDLATGVHRLCDSFDQTGDRRFLRFFRATERQADEKHRATTATWHLVAEDLKLLDREAKAAAARRAQASRDLWGSDPFSMLPQPTGGAR